MKQLLIEFRPTILFLVKFVGIYLAGNILYGIYVTSWYPEADPATQWVTKQTAQVLRVAGWPAVAEDSPHKPTTQISCNGVNIVSVYEGCNGLNVIVIFLAFVIAFGPFQKAMAWFIPMGIVLIHFANLLRIGLLFLVALYWPTRLYFAHKYMFTAFIFLVVFVLWVWWVRRFSPRLKREVS